VNRIDPAAGKGADFIYHARLVFHQERAGRALSLFLLF